MSSTTGERYENTSWLIPGILHTRGGVTHSYSQLVHDDCTYYFDVWPKPRHYTYTPVSILVLTHGYCGSTCSVFLRNLQEYHRVRTLVVGGLSGVPQSASSFSGGQVSSTKSMLAFYQEYDALNVSNAPIPFWTTCYFTFTLREIYSWTPGHEDEPMEFFLEPSDYHMDYSANNVANDTWLYHDASQYFTKCISINDTQPCNVNNGYGVFHCIVEQGIYSTQCDVTSCNPGFYKGDSGNCDPCNPGTYKGDDGIGPCESCSNAPSDAQYIGGGGATSIDECDFSCQSGFYDYKTNKCIKFTSPAAAIIISLVCGLAIGGGIAIGVVYYLAKKGRLHWKKKKYSHLSSEFIDSSSHDFD